MTHTILVPLTDASFDAAVAAGAVLVEFGASWCPPCRAIEPHLEAIARDRAGALTVCTVDADDSVDVSARYGVRALPTLLLFIDGKPRAQLVGAQPRARLDAWLDANGAPRPALAASRT